MTIEELYQNDEEYVLFLLDPITEVYDHRIGLTYHEAQVFPDVVEGSEPKIGHFLIHGNYPIARINGTWYLLVTTAYKWLGKKAYHPEAERSRQILTEAGEENVIISTVRQEKCNPEVVQNTSKDFLALCVLALW